MYVPDPSIKDNFWFKISLYNTNKQRGWDGCKSDRDKIGGDSIYLLTRYYKSDKTSFSVFLKCKSHKQSV